MLELIGGFFDRRYASFVVTYSAAATDPTDRSLALLLLHDTGVLQEKVPGFLRFFIKRACHPVYDSPAAKTKG